MRQRMQPHGTIFPPHRTVPATLAGLAFACLAALLCLAAPALAGPRNDDDLKQLTASLLETKIKPDAIPALYRPEYTTTISAALSLEDPEPVFVVRLPDGPRIYPQRIMVWHEVVNEVVGDATYCITYSPLTGVLAAYKGQAGRFMTTFGVDGRLLYNNTVLFDRATGSLWSQLLGIAIDGPLRGKVLQRIPAWWTTWGVARAAMPDAKVLATPTAIRRSYGKDPYGSYLLPGTYYDDDRIMYAVPKLDRRMKPKTPILGLDVQGQQLAIDVATVRKDGVVNIDQGPMPLVAVVDKRLNVIRVYDRTVWGKPATFALKKNSPNRLVDTESGSEWSIDGKAEVGPMKGAVLNELIPVNAMWFAWSSFHPATLVVPVNDAWPAPPQSQPQPQLNLPGLAPFQ
ncbi:DUF3179 domain-containing protein [Nitratidesulfovibrio liaohensis]|uniref:DUF3179 domain-containing protein n=1 Tax=Nitratidesulfovibrio liaohensis TaxID=2604158 RepID=A0ABY9R1R7_9BACT|nr:DUF3179 domain-containing protein [Nitratidesulfovibrio liaohensis]WMW65664.1 DUF3179 domain-containing protein [Nitratidesulfovibrio liaohensis]